jgi:outer membrane protein OmpA-like peptidoglycan-associated protein
VLHDVTFATASASLTAQAEETLREAAATLRSRPGARIEVAGYTDDTGDRAFNEQLSLNRALAVRAFLIEAGVPADYLTAQGYGPADPIASNATAEGRRANRRVELHIVE